MKRLWTLCWFGTVYSVIAVAAAAGFVIIFGPMFGEWGMLPIAIALLVLGILGVSGVSALDHQPNPYGRTNPLYGLQDVPEHSTLESARFGWITQLAPMVVAIGALLVLSWML